MRANILLSNELLGIAFKKSKSLEEGNARNTHAKIDTANATSYRENMDLFQNNSSSR